MLITGILALSYVAINLIGARIYQKNAELTLEKQIQAEEQHKAEQPHPFSKKGMSWAALRFRGLEYRWPFCKGRRRELYGWCRSH